MNKEEQIKFIGIIIPYIQIILLIEELDMISFQKLKLSYNHTYQDSILPMEVQMKKEKH